MPGTLAPAKVNLTLHVTGRRADGYHLLDSVVAFADIGDRLSVAPGDGLTVTGPFAAGVPTDDGNLIRRALRLAGARRAVTLEKNLPHPAGLGGGSSDAATVLRLIGADLAPAQLLSLGADVPCCHLAISSQVSGIGEKIRPLGLPGLPAVLVNPGLSVATPDVFRALSIPVGTTRDAPDPGIPPEGIDRSGLIDWLSTRRNDLEATAIALAPGIADTLDDIRGSGAAIARMSGSGATCFGLYRDAEAAARAADALIRPGRWVRACTLR